jgi:CubicO group peptidase (beta-lactamase class C family)
MCLTTPVLSLALSACLLPAQGPTREERLRFLETELEKQRVELHIPGFAISIVQGDEVIWAHGFGLADVEKERAVTPETLFAIGSATKAFTATLAGMLVDEGKLAWDAPITEYLPDFVLPIRTADEHAYVCLRDLLSHRTGFARGDLLWANGKASAKTILATTVKAEPWADFRKEFHYNNIMLLAAGEAMRAVTGKPWSDLLRERILEPLGMHDTNTSVAIAQKDPRLALGYQWNENEGQGSFVHKPMRVLDAIAPAGAINSNVLDMARWVRFQLGHGELEGKRLISEDALRETWTQQNLVAPQNGYGMGWFLHTWRGESVIEHGGNIDGFGAEVAMLPDSKLGFVLLTNVTATPLQAGSMEIVWNAMLGDISKKETPASDHAPYLGTYLANFGILKDAKLTVLEKNGKLAVDVPGQMAYELKEPDADGKWEFAMTNQIAVSFERNDKGEVTLLKMYQAGLVFEAPREGVPIPAEIDLDDARRFLGQYQDPALPSALTVVFQNNRLAVDIPKQMVCELHVPDADGKRFFRVNPALAVRFDEDGEGKVGGLTFFEGATERVCPRVADSEADALITAAALHELRKSDARKSALQALGSVRMRGKVKLVHVGIEGTMQAIVAGADRWRATTSLEPYATIERCFVDDSGATASSLAPYEEVRGKFLESARMDNPLASVLDWRDFFSKTTVLRAEELEGRKVWVVKLTADEDLSSTVWVDAETGDTLREESTLPLPGGLGALPRTVTYSDFRETEGLRIPYRTESQDEASGKTVLELESFEAHLDLPETAFRLTATAGEDR